MKCYFCQEEIGQEPSVPAGGGKELHAKCVDNYRQYLRGIVTQLKKGETQ
jgi:hypothetical protein